MLPRLLLAASITTITTTTTTTTTVRAEGFTFPTNQVNIFIVGDLVNVTWDVDSPRFSLYEVCATAVVLESNSTNASSYIWNATRDNYRESGCVFELEPLHANGVTNPPNLTSVLFGVNKRYSNDPAPTAYNFGGSLINATSSSSTGSTSTSLSTSSPTAVVSTSILVFTSTAASTSTPSSPSSTNTHTSALATSRNAGIGIGVPLGILSLCSAGFSIMWYRRRRTQYEMVEEAEEVSSKFKSLITTITAAATYSHNRVASGTETLVSELSAQNYVDAGRGGSRPGTSEVMGMSRAEME